MKKKIRRIIKYIILAVAVLALFVGVFYFHFVLSFKWHTEERVSAMFEAIQRDDFRIAVRYWDMSGKSDVDDLRKFLRYGELEGIKRFRVIDSEFGSPDKGGYDNRWVIVYVKFDQQEVPHAFFIRGKGRIAYSSHNRYME